MLDRTESIVLDAGPLISNDPPASRLASLSTQSGLILFTTPTALAEVRDPAARARVETVLAPFLRVRAPGARARALVAEFARRTGDAAVLARADLELLALAAEVQLERGGRVRRMPGEKLEGDGEGEGKGEKVEGEGDGKEKEREGEGVKKVLGAPAPAAPWAKKGGEAAVGSVLEPAPASVEPEVEPAQPAEAVETAEPAVVERQADDETKGEDEQKDKDAEEDQIAAKLGSITVSDEPAPDSAPTTEEEQPVAAAADVDEEGFSSESESDADDWITPASLKKQKEKDTHGPGGSADSAGDAGTGPIRTALLTGDFAMQNVCLGLGLALLSPALRRIGSVRSYVGRCHGCFAVDPDTAAQFCRRCGQATMTRVTCVLEAGTGRRRLFLKKNMQWHNRGARFSIPKPAAGAAGGPGCSSRTKKGAGAAWGAGLILAPDQKEYVRALDAEKREAARRERAARKGTAPADEDDLDAGFFGGVNRNKATGRPRVGAGRNVNASRKKRK